MNAQQKAQERKKAYKFKARINRLIRRSERLGVTERIETPVPAETGVDWLEVMGLKTDAELIIAKADELTNGEFSRVMDTLNIPVQAFMSVEDQDRLQKCDYLHLLQTTPEISPELQQEWNAAFKVAHPKTNNEE